MRKLRSKFGEALIIACKYMHVHLFLASGRQHLKCCEMTGGYRRQLGFFDLCQVKVLLLVKVELIWVFFFFLPSFPGFMRQQADYAWFHRGCLRFITRTETNMVLAAIFLTSVQQLTGIQREFHPWTSYFTSTEFLISALVNPT